MNQRLIFVSQTIALALIAAACGGGSDNLPPPPPPPPPPPVVASAPPVEAAPVEEHKKEPELPAVTLTLGEASPTPKPAPTVRILSPAKGASIDPKKAADFAIKLDVKNWKTAKDDAHVHLILDNKPYKPIYDTKTPIKLSELAAGEISEGHHVLVAFPSRANHESVKGQGAVAIVSFFVGKKEKVAHDVTKEPTLIYSRPKGEYKGDHATRVLVDFQLANATLAEGKDTVSIHVSGPGIESALTKTATSFGAPFYLEHLRAGSYKLTLELLGADGHVIDGPWNSTSREITIAPSEDASHEHVH